MSRLFRVLVFPAGEINAVEIHAALSRTVNVELFGASSVRRHGPHVFARYREDVPLIGDPLFVESFNRLLTEWSIDVIIPTHDSVVEFLVEHRGELAATLLGPDRDTAAVCRDKGLTYERFADCAFTPRVFQRTDEALTHMVFVKPKRGQGSVGARSLRAGDPSLNVVDWNAEVVTELLPGEEVTVDCLTDRHGQVAGVFPRSRERTFGGVSVSGTALPVDAEIREMAEIINDRLRFLGMWYFQSKRAENGRWKLMEISARGSGAQCLTRARGVNLPLLSVYAAMGLDVQVMPNTYRVSMDRTLTNRYEIDYEYDRVYLDYDDTVTSPAGLDPDMMRLVFQFRNEGKSIVLLTRHALDIHTSLRERRIAHDLFDEIVHITDGRPKADYINPSRAIFIDNAFVERRAVAEAYGIPVFDVDTTEVLHKWIR